MKRIIENEKYGTIVYSESFWTGKKGVNINGMPLERVNKKTFKLENGDTATLTGNSLTGISLGVGGDVIPLSAPMKWYEIAIAIGFFVFVLVWSNIPELCSILPLISGAVGGAINGVCNVAGIFLAASLEKSRDRLLVLIGFGIISFLACMAGGFIYLSLAF